MVIFWILINLSVIFDATGDALMKRGKWILSKTFQSLMIACFAGMIILAQYMPFKIITFPVWAQLILMYGLVRIGLFNAIWGIVAFKIKHWNWYYLGKTSLWDRSLEWIINDSWFARKFQPTEKFVLGWFYVISWFFSIGVLIQGFYIIHE
jgi:hypothetical protein